jgi:ABC-type transporter lipoprotein component MlaA
MFFSSARIVLTVGLVCCWVSESLAQPAPSVSNNSTRELSPRDAPAETVILPRSVPDPLEPFNRVVWAFNREVMTDVVKPTSKAYRFIVRKPIRTGIGNFGRNIAYPGRLINNLLQGKWTGARD